MTETHDASIEMTSPLRAPIGGNSTAPVAVADNTEIPPNAGQDAQQPSSGGQARDIFSHSLSRWRNNGEEDALQRYIESHSAADPASRQLLRSYGTFKSEPSGDLFGSLVALRTAQRSDLPLSIFEYMNLEPNTQFSSCLDQLRNRLRGSDSTFLQIWWVEVCPSSYHGLTLEQLFEQLLT